MPVNTIRYDDSQKASKRKGRDQPVWRCRARQLEPRLDLLKPGKRVAVDCEGVIFDEETGDEKKGLGRVSAVDEDEQLIYDTFTYHPPDVPVSLPLQFLNLGVKPNDIKPENGAQPIAKVLNDLKQIFDISGVVVGHAIHNDMQMLRKIDWSAYEVRDTQRAAEYQQYAKDLVQGPKLKDLSEIVLGQTIQKKSHSSIVDARATIKLYNPLRDSIDRAQARPVISTPSDSGSASATSSGKSSGESTHSASSSLTNISSVSSSVVANKTTSKVTATTVASRVYRYPPALPDLPWLRKLAVGRVFDKRTSRYINPV